METILKIALQCETKKEFRTEHVNAYKAASALGILGKVCSHFKCKNVKPPGYWTYETIRPLALACKTKREFRAKHIGAHGAAHRLGIYNEVSSHLKGEKQLSGHWKLDTIHPIALQCTSRSEFEKLSTQAYDAARKQGIIDFVCSHMELKHRALDSWTFELVHVDALKCDSLNEFKKSYYPAYSAAYRMGIVEAVSSHMVRNKPIGYWTLERIKVECLKYKTRVDLFHGSPSAHSIARKLGKLDEACSHMAKVNRWCESAVLTESIKYTDRKSFRKACSGAYSWAWENGKLDKVCAHMNYNKNGFLILLALVTL